MKPKICPRSLALLGSLLLTGQIGVANPDTISPSDEELLRENQLIHQLIEDGYISLDSETGKYLLSKPILDLLTDGGIATESDVGEQLARYTDGI